MLYKRLVSYRLATVFPHTTAECVPHLAVGVDQIRTKWILKRDRKGDDRAGARIGTPEIFVEF